jgi:hypothetical protein
MEDILAATEFNNLLASYPNVLREIKGEKTS